MQTDPHVILKTLTANHFLQPACAYVIDCIAIYWEAATSKKWCFGGTCLVRCVKPQVVPEVSHKEESDTP